MNNPASKPDFDELCREAEALHVRRVQPNFEVLSRFNQDIGNPSHWLVWVYYADKKSSRVSKLPISPKTGRASREYEDCGTFEEAQAYYKSNPKTSGIGIRLSGNLICIDLDTKKTTERSLVAFKDGKFESWVQSLVKDSNSYAEVSASGEGIHIFGYATLPAGNHQAGNIQIYDGTKGHYIAMTGKMMPLEV